MEIGQVGWKKLGSGDEDVDWELGSGDEDVAWELGSGDEDVAWEIGSVHPCSQAAISAAAP